MSAPAPRPSAGDDGPSAEDYAGWADLAKRVGSRPSGAPAPVLRDIPLPMLVDAVTILRNQRERHATVVKASSTGPSAAAAAYERAYRENAPGRDEARWELIRAIVRAKEVPDAPAGHETNACTQSWDAWLRQVATDPVDAPSIGSTPVAATGSRPWAWQADDHVVLRLDEVTEGAPGLEFIRVPSSTPITAIVPVLRHAARDWQQLATFLGESDAEIDGL